LDLEGTWPDIPLPQGRRKTLWLKFWLEPADAEHHITVLWKVTRC